MPRIEGVGSSLQKGTPEGMDLKGTPFEALLGGGEAPAGEENPWRNPFMEVYEKTKVGALENLADIQKQMGESFAHRGGYFGGKHAISQGKVAAETGTALDQLLAETELGASERQYEDWKRAENQKMGLLGLIPTLLGTEGFENIVQMPGQSKGGGLGSLAGGAAGSANDGAVYVREARVKNSSDTLTVHDLQTSFTSEDQSGWDGTITTSGTNVLVRVTGATNNNVDWITTTTVQSI